MKSLAGKAIIFATLLAMLSPLAAAAGEKSGSYCFDYGGLQIYVNSSERTESFVAKNFREVTTIEAKQNLAGWGSPIYLQVLINDVVRAHWTFPATSASFYTYTQYFDVNFTLQQGDEIKYRIASTGSGGAGSLTGKNYVTFHGALVKNKGAYVGRFYTFGLERDADASGISYYGGKLESEEMSGADVAKAFLNGDEFKNRNLSNQQFVTILYKTLLGREPDKDGMEGWLADMNNELSREAVLDGFLGTDEFAGLCEEYGVTPHI